MSGPTSARTRPASSGDVRAVRRGRARVAVAVLVVAGVMSGCGSATGDAAPADPAPSADGSSAPPAAGRAVGTPGGDTFPDVIGVVVESPGGAGFDISATLSSPYDSPERYADAWRVSTPDGTVVGVRELAHDHADEQPFTRSLAGVDIPEGTAAVVVEGRDSANGWGGQRWEVPLP